MFCGITGEACLEPVISKKSGHVFEKRIITKHLKLTHTCPITKEELALDDLLDLKTNVAVRPRPPTATSVPGLMQIFQSEWDALMLETYTLKQHLETVRQELAQALYQHDAACRVIARLIKERDSARSALSSTQVEALKAGVPQSKAPKEEDKDSGITQQVVQTMQTVAKRLSKGRKKRIKTLQGKVVRKDTIKRYGVLSSNSLHSASKPGVLCLDLHAKQEDLILTGGADGTGCLFNLSTGKILDKLKAHKRKVTDIRFHREHNVVFTTSADNTSIIWTHNESGKYTPAEVLRDHTAEVVGCSLHPSGDFLVTASLDKTWCFYDVPTGLLRQKVIDDKIEAGYSRVTFHPDGLILGAGTADSMVRIFDVKLQKNVANFKGHSGKITGMSFSENGFFLASADERGVVKLWDLRKLQNFHTISLAQKDQRSSIHFIEFDQSGSYLGVGGDSETRIYHSKSWDLVKTWYDHKQPVTSIKFASEAAFFASTSQDRTLKVFGEQPTQDMHIDR